MSGNKNVQVVLRVTISLKENVSAASHRPFERKRVSRFASDLLNENVSAASRQTLLLSASTEFNSARYFSKFSDLNSE